MKTTNISFVFFLFLSTCFYAQNESKDNFKTIKEIISTSFVKVDGKQRSFEEITREADDYFKRECPQLTFGELSLGDFRDGDFVKYQRWKSFWKYRLNDEGALADFTNVTGSEKTSFSSATCNDYDISANWLEVNYNGNYGYQIDMGRVSSIGFHPSDQNTFLVGAAFGGLWKTTSGGQSYVNLNDDLPHTSVADIIMDTINPNRVFIALSDIVWYGPSGIGIYESNDGGVTFSPTGLTFTLPQNVRIYEMDVNPNNPSEFLVATSNGLYRTTDYFQSSTTLVNGDFRSVKYSLNSNNVYAGGANGEYYLSTNNGQTFNYNSDFGSGQVRISVSNKSNSGYVAFSNSNALNVSSNHGSSFSQSTLPESNCVIAFANGSDSNLMVGNFECYSSSNGGSNFQATTHWLGNGGLPVIHVDQRNIYTNPLQADYVYYCNDGGIFRYSVPNNSFENLSSDLFITQYYDIAVSQTDALVLGAGSQDNGNVTRNQNGQWQSYEPTADGMGQEIDFNNSNIRYYSIQNGNLRRWNNGSLSYISPSGQGGNGAWETPFKLDPNNSDRIVIGYKSVYASNNRGDSWTNIGNNISSGNLEQLAIAKSNSNKMYASRYNTLYAKNSGNNSWVTHYTPVNQYISDLEVHPTDENTVYISYGGFTGSSKVYKSSDGGANWENISHNLPNAPILSLETYDTMVGSILVGTYNGVYFLDNGATTWQKLGCLPNTSVNDIEIQYLNGDEIYVGTHGRGMFKVPLAVLSVDDESSMEGFSIYPNPTKGNVTIMFGKEVREANVSIYNLVGQLIRKEESTIVDDKALLDLSRMNAGMYLIEIETDRGRVTKRIVVE